MAKKQDKTRAVTVTINVPCELDNLGAWLKEQFGWSLKAWIKWHVERDLTHDLNLDENMAEQLEERFDLPRVDFAANLDKIKQLLGKPKLDYDPLNRIIPTNLEGDCPHCHAGHVALYQVMENGKITITVCWQCMQGVRGNKVII
jgi:hypothetical protein